MPIRILMPALSPTMTEGNLTKWMVKEGDSVAAGDVIAEIETDKATMEVEAVDEGKVGRILVAEGTEGVAVNSTIAVLLEEDEDPSALDDMADEPAAPAPPAAETPPPPAAAPAAAPAADGERILASPLARRMAAQAGLELTAISGTGPKGRIVKADIEAALAGATPAVKAAPVAAPSIPGTGYRVEPLTNMRKVIARRLQESKQTIPHFYLSIDCNLDALLDIRKQLNERTPDLKLSVNDFVIRAAALALAKVPAANASWMEDGIHIYDDIDVAVAVAVEAGLITPIIRNADRKGLAAISTEMKALAERAREGKLAPEEFQGGTFTISNLGMYGIDNFQAVINPPQAAILAVGAGVQKPVVKDGALAVATMMTCTLSCDHRVVDGSVGSAFLAAYKTLIEDPLAMLL